jgi:hypothetical protein
VNPAVLKVLREHLAVSNQFLEEGNYQRILVQANRTITESTIFSDIPALAAVGLVFRLAALQVQPTAISGELLAYPQKKAFTSLVAALDNFIANSDRDPKVPWVILEEFHNNYWADLRSRVEGKAYSKNPEFVEEVVGWAVTTLHDSWGLVSEPIGLPIAGLVIELDRVMKAHGATARQLANLGVLQSLSWYTDYARYQSRTKDGGIDSDKLKGLMDPLIQGITPLLMSAGDEATFFSGVASFAHAILRSWRTDFAKFYDLYLRQEKERSVGLQLVPGPAKAESAEPTTPRKKKSS